MPNKVSYSVFLPPIPLLLLARPTPRNFETFPGCSFLQSLAIKTMRRYSIYILKYKIKEIILTQKLLINSKLSTCTHSSLVFLNDSQKAFSHNMCLIEVILLVTVRSMQLHLSSRNMLHIQFLIIPGQMDSFSGFR